MVVKTIVRVENNNEIFMTDAPEVDFDLLNEQNARQRAETQGGDETQISASEAFKVFRDMQQPVLLSDVQQSQRDILRDMELPRSKLDRLQKELEELEEELRLLEKEDASYFGLPSESELQLREVDLLRD